MPKTNETVRINITLPLVVKESMATYAAKSKRSMSDLMAEAIEEKAQSLAQAELEMKLEAAYSEMSDDIRDEVNQWDAVSADSWDRLYAVEKEKRQGNPT